MIRSEIELPTAFSVGFQVQPVSAILDVCFSIAIPTDWPIHLIYMAYLTTTQSLLHPMSKHHLLTVLLVVVDETGSL